MKAEVRQGRENVEHMGKILAGLNQERAAAQLAPLVRDAAQDALAAQGATLRGGERRETRGPAFAPAAGARSHPLRRGLVEQAVGQHFLVIVLAEAAR